MEHLFNKYELSSLFPTQSAKVKEYIATLDRNGLLAADIEALLDALKKEFHVNAIELQEEDISVSQKESKIDISHDPERFILDRSKPFYIEGFKVTYHAPYNGDKILFQCQPSTFNYNPPVAKVESKELHFIFECSYEKVQSTKQDFERELGKVKEYISWVNRDVALINQQLDSLLVTEIQSRRNRILESQNQINTLGYKIRSDKPTESSPRTVAKQSEKYQQKNNTEYDVAFSFAGEDRDYVERVATFVRDSGVNVFYDKFEGVNLWGKNLIDHFAEIYSKRSKFVVMFISTHYAQKAWPNHERQHAQATAFKVRKDYLLPARFDDTEIPGLSDTISYIDLREIEPEIFGEMIMAKIKNPQ